MLKEYRNVFTLADYPPGENGLSEVPLEHIYEAMDKFFPTGYSFVPVAAGITNEGRAFYSGKLSVQDKDNVYDVSGSADSPYIGLAGVQTLAFKNAVLRGLGMGHELYAQNADAQNSEVPSAPRAQYEDHSMSQYSGGQTAPPMPRTFTPRNGGGQGGFKPWDGTARVKSETSPYRGQAYKDLPLEVIVKWAESGTNTAIMEYERRNKAGDLESHSTPAPRPSQGGRNPFARA